MKAAALIFLAVMFVCQSVFAQSELKEYRSEKGGFSVKLPRTPTEEAKNKFPGSFDETTGSHLVEVGHEQIYYYIQYADFRENSVRPAKDIFNQNNSTYAGFGKIRRQRDISLDDFPGREVIIDMEQGFTQISRMYLVKNRLYEITAMFPKELEILPNIQDYFRSFELLNQNSTGWKKYVSQEGRFSVLFPGKPKLENRTLQTQSGLIVAHMMTFTDSESVEYSVIYSILPAPKGKIDAKKVLNAATSGVGSLSSSKDFKFNNQPSRKIVFETKAGDRVTKILCLAGNRLYQISVATKKENADKPEANTFLDSFRLTP